MEIKINSSIEINRLEQFETLLIQKIREDQNLEGGGLCKGYVSCDKLEYDILTIKVTCDVDIKKYGNEIYDNSLNALICLVLKTLEELNIKLVSHPIKRKNIK